MAVSAYSSQGLLKKNPLLGTSMGSDPTRSAQAQKFGELHERAKGYTQDKAGFQKIVGGEYEKLKTQGLANLATQQSQLGATRTELKGHQAREFDINDAITYANETGAFLSRGGDEGMGWQTRKGMNALQGSNALVDRDAQLYWDELGRGEGGAGIQAGYMQGFRPEDMMGQYETGYGTAQGRLSDLGLGGIENYGFQTPLRKRRSALSAEFGSLADPWSRANPWTFDPGDGSVWDVDKYAWTDPDTGEVTAEAPTSGSDWMNREGWGNMSNDLDGDGIPDIMFDASGQMMPLGHFGSTGEYIQDFEDRPENRLGPEGQTFVPGQGYWGSESFNEDMASGGPDGGWNRSDWAQNRDDRQWQTELGLSDPLGYDPMEVRDFGPDDFLNDETYSKRFFDPRMMGGGGKKGRKATAAAARMAAYMDKMGLDRASSEIDLLEQTPKTAAALRRIGALDEGIIGSRKSLADRAEFYGGFFG